MSHMTGLFCLNCGKRVPESEFRLKCPSCKDILEVQYDLEKMKKSLISRPLQKKSGSLLKQWIDILPINDAGLIDRVSLGEQETPLVRSTHISKHLGIKNMFFKLEFLFLIGAQLEACDPVTQAFEQELDDLPFCRCVCHISVQHHLEES